VHVYGVPGVYTVSLSVTNADNQVDLAVKTAYITAVPPGPSLKVRREPLDLVVEWSTSETGFSLTRRADLSSGAWSLAPQIPVVSQNTNYAVRVPISGSQFYRLEQR
jgi:PKD repeat protein